LKLPRLRFAPVREATFADLVRALAGEVAEADATFQLRQRLAWRDATGGASAVLEGLDRLGNLGLQEVRFSLQLEPAPRPWYVRLWDFLARRPVTRRDTFRFARPGGRNAGAPAFQISVTVGRSSGGAWDSTIEGLPPGTPPENLPVPALGN